LTLEGTVDVGEGGNTITNITTAATGDQVDPSTAGDDLQESVTPDLIVEADLGIAKSIAGTPEVLFNGNSLVTFEVVIENTGNADLASLSLIEDLATQFGDAYVNASGLTLVAGTTNPTSTIAIDTAFNGGSSTELLDQTVNNVLAIGDSFTLQFTVEVDPAPVTAPLENQVVGTGDAVDASGNPLLDSSGNPIVASERRR